MKTEKYDFTKEQLKKLKEFFKVEDVETALENWAYVEFDLKHNGSKCIGKIGKTFIEIQELP